MFWSAVTGLVGCRSDPTVAAYVGDTRITEDRVDEVVDAVVSVVAEMTGYPPELLDLDLDLEADLGVDTVKQAEVFAAVRGRYGVERDPNLRLRDFPTLRHVIGFVRTHRPDLGVPDGGQRVGGDGEAGDARDRHGRRLLDGSHRVRGGHRVRRRRSRHDPPEPCAAAD